MRVRKKNWAEGELSSNKIILKDPAHKGKWHELFGNPNPIQVEIGCGKGNFITEHARKFPEINFIAIEKEPVVIVNGARKVRELNEQGENLKNIFFITGNAADLRDIFEVDELSRIYLNFSDPWPNRKKWAKRRLTHKNFLNIYDSILNASGEIHLKTDNTVLFEFSLNEFSAENWGLKNISLDLHHSDFEGNIMTEYEMKFSSKGMPIYRLEAFKRKNTCC